MPPNREALRSLLGDELLAVWEQTCARIEALYDTDRLWNRGWRDWVYEYKYRRGGRTLVAYDRAETYHDGKWVMFEPEDARALPDLEALLALKRRPNRGRLSKGGEKHGWES